MLTVLQVLDPSKPQLSVPLYLHPQDPSSRPLMSHYASSHNVLFKITVPKRTGRKRKRGSNEPWQGEVEQSVQDTEPSATLRSKAGLDDPKILRRKLQDNPDRYEAEAVGVIKHTHRYRGMADFNYSMKNNGFMNDFTDKILSGEGMNFWSIVLRTVTDSNGSIQVSRIFPEARRGHHPQPSSYRTAFDDPDQRPLLLFLLPKPVCTSGRYQRWWFRDGQHHVSGQICGLLHRHQ